MQNSRKKHKFAGSKEVYDQKTGESLKSTLLKLHRQDLNFVKTFLPEKGHYLMHPKKMTLPALQLYNYLIVVMGRDNNVLAPSSQIEERTGMSSASIARGRLQLLEFDYIRKVCASNYMLNPAIICRVDGDKREELYSLFMELKKTGKADK